jgi:hypothetical protein
VPSAIHGNRPPFRLASNIIYFHDWRYVDHGQHQWRTETGEDAPLFTVDALPTLRYECVDMPHGIRLVAQKATKSEPVITPEIARAVFLFGGTLIHDEGVYRFWHECWPEEDIGKPNMGVANYLRYAESDNGVDWRFPNLGVIEHNGSTRNNIVYGTMLTGNDIGYHGGSVFKDPSAPPEERYKGFHLGHIPDAMYAEFIRKRPEAVDPYHANQGLFGAVSPDGIHWTPIREPLVAHYSDTHNCCTYDVQQGKYVAYCRNWFFRRRTIGRMETEDFRNFPLPEDLFWPGATMEPHDLWYSQPKTLMPGTIDYHIIFPMRWSLPTDSFHFHLATSPDGVVWGFVPDASGRVPGDPVCSPGYAGEWDGGVVAPGIGMVDLPGNKIGIMYAGSPVPHKHARKPPLGKIAWATWTKGRLVALESPQDAFFVTQPITYAGSTMRINARTQFTGYIEVEALKPDGSVVPGRGFADCDRVNGDDTDRLVTWRGEKNIGYAEGAQARFRFRMRSAELFSVRFE